MSITTTREVSKLALLGGPKVIEKKFRISNSIGVEEKNAVAEVMDSGVLSKFLGAWSDDFLGGPKVREFERACENYFDVKHAITVNSWTSGLIAAVGALDIEPGDEVIVSPWTMCASATAILQWNAIPVFADIDPRTFNLDPASVAKNITKQTKAILAIDIFGQPCDVDALKSIVGNRDIKIISDSAQAPGAFYKDQYAGTVSDIGGISLNYHKHIHTGEGGVLFTNNDEYADRMRLIRNHAEAVVGPKGVTNIANMIGFNFRLGEIECAIGIEQLKKLSSRVKSRQDLAHHLNKGLKGLPGLMVPYVNPESSHVYYIYAISIDAEQLGCSKDLIARALQAEGLEVSTRYQNLHLLPMYQKKIAYGSKGFPWTASFCKRDVDYSKGICPQAEYLNEKAYLGIGLCMYDYELADIDLIVQTFHKVWSNLDSLRGLA